MDKPSAPPPEAQALAIASLMTGMNPGRPVVTASAGGVLVIVVRPDPVLVPYFEAAVAAVDDVVADPVTTDSEVN